MPGKITECWIKPFCDVPQPAIFTFDTNCARVDFRGEELGVLGLQMLAAMLPKCTRLTHLDISSAAVVRGRANSTAGQAAFAEPSQTNAWVADLQGLHALTTRLRSNRVLLYLDISGNTAMGTAGGKMLGSGLRDNKIILAVRVHKCDLPVQELRSHVQVGLQQKHLRYLDVVVIAGLISSNQQIHSLNLSENGLLNYCDESNQEEISDGVAVLAEVVAAHTAIQMLKLYACWLPVQDMKNCDVINLPQKSVLHHADMIVIGTVIVSDPSPSLRGLNINGRQCASTASGAAMVHRYFAPALAHRYLSRTISHSIQSAIHSRLFPCPIPSCSSVMESCLTDKCKLMAQKLQHATTLDLSQLQLCVMDAITLGAFFQVNRVLTSLTLSQNYICGLLTEQFEDMTCTKNGERWKGLLGRHTADGIYYLCGSLATLPLTKLDISRCHLRKEGARHVAEALLKSSMSLTSLNIASNDIEARGVEHLAKALDNLRDLNLEDNHIQDEGAKHLALALLDNTTLETLNVASNFVGNAGARELGIAFKAPRQCLQRLTFGNTMQVTLASDMVQARFQNKGIGAPDGILIASFLHRCYDLTKLDLSCNSLGRAADTAGMDALTAAFAENKTVWTLDLRKNALSATQKDNMRETFTARTNLEPVPARVRRQPGVHPPPMPRVFC
jgi:Ran GTPase-activating protein (RanGAP) involved in mRNA processing and transport